MLFTVNAVAIDKCLMIDEWSGSLDLCLHTVGKFFASISVWR